MIVVDSRTEELKMMDLEESLQQVLEEPEKEDPEVLKKVDAAPQLLEKVQSEALKQLRDEPFAVSVRMFEDPCH